MSAVQVSLALPDKWRGHSLTETTKVKPVVKAGVGVSGIAGLTQILRRAECFHETSNFGKFCMCTNGSCLLGPGLNMKTAQDKSRKAFVWLRHDIYCLPTKIADKPC